MGGTGPRYRNGQIPASELVAVERGHVAARGTAARWAALKADVLKNEGVLLRITGESENAYRSLAGQTFARRQACARGRCDDAAVPSFSSHGGSLNGRDSGAIDVANWSVLGKTKFYAYARKHGFEPGFFDWEPWHIIDWDPYNVPSSGGNSTPTNSREQEVTLYLKATTGTSMVRQNNIYVTDGPLGAFRGTTNLEDLFLEQQAGFGLIVIQAITGADLELLFALRGVCEQPAVPGISWGGGNHALTGLGAITGRIKYPGTAGIRGNWHYPQGVPVA